MEPTYDQVQAILTAVELIRDNLVLVYKLLHLIFRLVLVLGAWTLASVLWRNFVLAKNQRSLW